MAEFDFSMDPAELNKEIDKAQSKMQSGVDKLKKYDSTLGESERIILEIAKKRARIARAENLRRAEWQAQGGGSGFQLGASGPSAARRVRARGLSIPGNYGVESSIDPMNVGGGALSIPGGNAHFPSGAVDPFAGATDAVWHRGGPPRGGGAGGEGGKEFFGGVRQFMTAVGMFAAASTAIGQAMIGASQTRSENYQQVGDLKSRAQRAAKTLGIDEGGVMNTITTSADPQAALRAHEQWAAKKRRTGIQPPAYAMDQLASGAQRGAFSWEEAAQSGLEGTWGRYARQPGLTGDSKDYYQHMRGKTAAEYDAKSQTWQRDMDAAKTAVYSDAEWEAFKAANPHIAQIPGARQNRALWGNDYNKYAYQDSLSDLPTGAGYGGAPPAGPQTPVQQQGVDLRSGGRGVQQVRIVNPDAVRPRPQLDIRSGNHTRTEN